LGTRTARVCAALLQAYWTASAMPASWLAVVNLWEPNSPEKQKPAEGRALHPV